MASVIRRVLSVATSTAVWLIAGAALAHAHGGIAGPEELGPPVACSTVLGIASYWTVMLWPARKLEEEENNRFLKPKIARGKLKRRRRPLEIDKKEYPVRLVVNR
jgi:hypothetical protein